jgi:hypothetical protein
MSIPSPSSVARSAGRARSSLDGEPEAVAKLPLQLVQVERLGGLEERVGGRAQPDGIEAEPLVELEDGVGPQFGGQLPLSHGKGLEQRVQLRLGGLAAAAVELGAALAVGLVEEPRLHLAVGDVAAVEGHRQRRLAVGDVVGERGGAVADVGLGGEALELNGGGHLGQLDCALERGQVPVALVDPGHLQGRLAAGVVLVVLGERLGRHLLELVPVGLEVDCHAPTLPARWRRLPGTRSSS